MASKNIPEVHEWLVKSNFSFLRGASSPRKLLLTANALGYQSICINDFDGCYGLARAYNELKNLQKQGPFTLKLNYGTELHFKPDHHKPLLKQSSLVFNALNWEGYKNICQLASLAHKESKDSAYISLETLLEHNLSGVFVILPMRGGLGFFLQNISMLENLKQACKEGLYLSYTKTFNHFSDRLIPKVY